MRNISIELRIIIGVILFTLLIVGVERYQLSNNIIEQFVDSKKSKNQLLINTISPIIALNLSLGLDDANKEYLDTIVKQNKDLESFELVDSSGNKIYSYLKNKTQNLQKETDPINVCSQNILDPITGQKSGVVQLYFDNHEYELILNKNRETTFHIFGITFLILIIFIFLIKRELKYLKDLSKNVLVYDPKLNNFTLSPSNRNDEVGTIQNAIISMVTRIRSHSQLLDDVNQSLEVKIQERTKELEDANKQLKALSITDPLTQLANRRHFETHIHDIWQLAKRSHIDISIVMCDIDHFKSINDTYGHLFGDKVLKEMALILKNSLKRSTDFIARYGGEEFIIVLYDTKMSDAQEICSNAQNNLKKVEYKGAKGKPITMSFGISSMVPDEISQPEDLIKLADSALYHAKENGRDCIVAMGKKVEDIVIKK
jgi:diguanylate cyclase (GGDEF)-like protein